MHCGLINPDKPARMAEIRAQSHRYTGRFGLFPSVPHAHDVSSSSRPAIRAFAKMAATDLSQLWS